MGGCKIILEFISDKSLREIEVEDMKKMFCYASSIITRIVLICIMYVIMQWIESVYNANPGLRL